MVSMLAPAAAAGNSASVAIAPPALSAGVHASLQRAAATVIDDRSLVRSSGGWTSIADRAASRSTVSRSLRKGATLTTRNSASNGGAVLLRYGPKRGRVDVLVGSVKRVSVNTAATKVASRWVSFAGAGRVTVRVTTQGGGVYVDAVRLNAAALAPAFAPGGLRQLDRNASGIGGNGTHGVERVALSPGGRFVAYWSDAKNLVAGVNDGLYHLYVSDVPTGKVLGVADVNSAGTVLSQDNSFDAGRMVATWKPIAAGNTDSIELLFTTRSTNLFATTPAFDGPYLFSKNILTDALTAIPLAQVYEAAWSPDGHKIAFATQANYGTDNNTFLDIWSYDLRQPSIVTPVSANAAGVIPPCCNQATSEHFSWAKDSNRVLFESRSDDLVPGDTNAVEDVFIKTLSTGAIKRISTSAAGVQGNTRSGKPAWSPDNTAVAFDSQATNLVAGDTNIDYDIFVKTLATGAISLVSKDYQGRPTLFANEAPKWSPDGHRISYNSDNSSLTSKLDVNLYTDVYVVDLRTKRNQLVSVAASGMQGNYRSSQWYVMSPSGWTPDGRGLIFLSTSSNFSATDSNGSISSVFVKSL